MRNLSEPQSRHIVKKIIIKRILKPGLRMIGEEVRRSYRKNPKLHEAVMEMIPQNLKADVIETIKVLLRNHLGVSVLLWDFKRFQNAGQVVRKKKLSLARIGLRQS
ncbi:uncharacterized protein LOC117174212 [Belonocnema kinseyi]|uniref:uncharacterized protein LOC117174212 n=1 Tax=Belonocnema kinseyi TaxID=2817044 RepID=UPI00143DD585|nr:uncharacterized protein LOC117174212 [Belonocnema kinseyi]XP_033218980.1 uncharacterized protein LOC117174212 [Belonocnema kinseyi]